MELKPKSIEAGITHFQERDVWVYALYYKGNGTFHRKIPPTAVNIRKKESQKRYDIDKFELFKLNKNGGITKTKVPIRGSKSYQTLKIFESEDECYESFRLDIARIEKDIQADIDKLQKTLNEFREL